MLDVGDDQRIYWEASANPDGRPAVAVHGGPGRDRARATALFDPEAYLIVQFDQRGWGTWPWLTPERHPERVRALVLASPDTAVRGAGRPGLVPGEDELLSNEEAWQPNPAMRTRRFWMALARIVTHYLHHGAWLDDGQILAGSTWAARLPPPGSWPGRGRAPGCTWSPPATPAARR
jgi:pimeloyl-ACP methyl ester carboxylesterase